MSILYLERVIYGGAPSYYALSLYLHGLGIFQDFRFYMYTFIELRKTVCIFDAH